MIKITCREIKECIGSAFQEFMNDYVNNIINQHTINRNRSIQCFKSFIGRILRRLGYEVRKIRSSYYYFSDEEKKWALDFLLYVINNCSSLEFDLKLFEHDKERYEIVKFIRNKIFTAILPRIKKRKIFDEEDLLYQHKYAEFRSKIRKLGSYYILELDDRKYLLPINHFEPVVFYHRYGLDILPKNVLENVANKDFIDAGAFIGDSALILNELSPRRIYAFEPIKDNVIILQKTLSINNLNNVIIVEKALSNIEGTKKIIGYGSISFVSNSGVDVVETTTIDNFVRQHEVDVGLIKMDIEGSELEALRGGIATIKSKKPMLIVSVYHRGQDFFEIPKLLKSICLLYTSPSPRDLSTSRMPSSA